MKNVTDLVDQVMRLGASDSVLLFSDRQETQLTQMVVPGTSTLYVYPESSNFALKVHGFDVWLADGQLICGDDLVGVHGGLLMLTFAAMGGKMSLVVEQGAELLYSSRRSVSSCTVSVAGYGIVSNCSVEEVLGQLDVGALRPEAQIALLNNCVLLGNNTLFERILAASDADTIQQHLQYLRPPVCAQFALYFVVWAIGLGKRLLSDFHMLLSEVPVGEADYVRLHEIDRRCGYTVSAALPEAFHLFPLSPHAEQRCILSPECCDIWRPRYWPILYEVARGSNCFNATAARYFLEYSYDMLPAAVILLTVNRDFEEIYLVQFCDQLAGYAFFPHIVLLTSYFIQVQLEVLRALGLERQAVFFLWGNEDCYIDSRTAAQYPFLRARPRFVHLSEHLAATRSSPGSSQPDGGAEVCPVCLEGATHAVTLGCSHVVCPACLSEVRRCPLCQCEIERFTYLGNEYCG